MKKGFTKSFSLIELLISLIIMSLLLTAFSPLIAKKLKANDITVGSFGNNNNVPNNNSRNITKQDCDSLNAIFVPRGINVKKPLCVMKYNIGDTGIEDWSGVKRCEAGKDCEVQNGTSEEVTKENLQPACWVATSDKNTAGSGCNDNFGGYDGCKRTLCNWTGANQMCSNIGWRLPTKEELIAFTNDTYSSKEAFESGDGSLMFCNGSNGSISPMCPHLKNGCSGTKYGHCDSNHIWSSSSSSAVAWERYFLDNIWNNNAPYLGHGFSARCVLDNMEVLKKENKEPTKEFCDKFNAYFIDKTVSGLNRNICITKWNVGDGAGTTAPPIAIGSSVVTLKTEQTCADNSACCWSGNTAASSCSSAKDGGSYSGCNRTVCNYQGAYLSCYNWQYNDLPKGSWRLPNKEEIQYIAVNSATTVKNQGEKGLQLCDGLANTTTNGFTHCYWNTGKCPNSVLSNCYTYHIWLNNQAYCDTGGIYKGSISCGDLRQKEIPSSVRCVYDGLNYSETESK